MPKRARNFYFYPAGTNDRQRHKDYNRQRPESDKFYWTTTWKRLRAIHIRKHPLCIECRRQGRITAAVIVDHIKPRKDYPELSLDESNLRSLCRPCHNRIGAKAEGGQG